MLINGYSPGRVLSYTTKMPGYTFPQKFIT